MILNLISNTMNSTTINLNHLQSKSFELEKTSSKINLGDVFAERNGSYLNEFNLFLAHFNSIPNFIHEINIDCKKANKWFIESYKLELKELYYDKRYFNGSKTAEYDDVFYFLYDDLIVNFDTNQSRVRFLFRKTDASKVESIITGLKKFKENKSKRKPEISILYNSRFGITTKTLQILKPKLNLEQNYNDDFAEVHQIIVKRLSKKNDKGIVLLHGKSGTGKTFYIRHLISTLNKNVIFLPPNMAASITNPDLISILIDNPNSIFVIEDAENIVIDREKEGHSPVTALLNISDGLLSDCLNIQVICSFNTDLSRIDSALLRKGRLIANYEFKELMPEKAQMLSQKLGFSGNISSPMTLTAIYNQDEKEFSQMKKRNPIGFKSTL
ncbi:MAG TPA: AAA family ATPase [Candidatus Cloacimonadota bacterium]|nr:AAA family ATPase [Candidatus Cloacimonadota bacterium]